MKFKKTISAIMAFAVIATPLATDGGAITSHLFSDMVITANAESATTTTVTKTATVGDYTFNYDEIWVRHTAEESTYAATVTTATITKYNGTATSVSLPSKITYKGIIFTVKGIESVMYKGKIQNAFSENVKSVVIPSTVTHIGDYTFCNCSSLTSVTIPDSVTSIGSFTFENCSSLTRVTIPDSVTSIGSFAFQNCTSLKSVMIPATCTNDGTAFNGCSSLTTINRHLAVTSKTDANGIKMPVLVDNSKIRQVIDEFCNASYGVGFVDKYCSELCNYVVETETASWMPEYVKARQLYAWLQNHTSYEDELNGESKGDGNNHVYSSVFLSYGLYGEGESVCEGYSLAYASLLRTAGLEAYVVYGGAINYPGEDANDSHVWNVVKVDGKYYECDVTWDEGYPVTWQGAYTEDPTYHYFLKTQDEMANLHIDGKGRPIIKKSSSTYVDYVTGTGKYSQSYSECKNAIANVSTTSFGDKFEGGVLDNDMNFDGKVSVVDGTYEKYYTKYFNYTIDNSQLQYVLNYLCLTKLTPKDIKNAVING